MHPFLFIVLSLATLEAPSVADPWGPRGPCPCSFSSSQLHKNEITDAESIEKWMIPPLFLPKTANFLSTVCRKKPEISSLVSFVIFFCLKFGPFKSYTHPSHSLVPEPATDVEVLL